MAEIRQKMRGASAALNSYVGAEGQLLVDMSRLDLRVYDGVTAGGTRIPNFNYTEATYLKTSGGTLSGDLDLTGALQVGINNGAIGLSTSDGQGNANVTFNHTLGTPDQDGVAGRIVVNVDSLAPAAATMTFGVKSEVVNGVPVAIASNMTLSESKLSLAQNLEVAGRADVAGSMGVTGSITAGISVVVDAFVFGSLRMEDNKAIQVRDAGNSWRQLLGMSGGAIALGNASLGIQTLFGDWELFQQGLEPESLVRRDTLYDNFLQLAGGQVIQGDVTANKVALTNNDGYGNASVTFNHASGTPMQDGTSGRLTVFTDAADGHLQIQLGNNRTDGVIGALTTLIDASLAKVDFTVPVEIAGTLETTGAATVGAALTVAENVTMGNNLTMGGSGPQIRMIENDAAADVAGWRIAQNNSNFFIQPLNSGGTGATGAVILNRTATGLTGFTASNLGDTPVGLDSLLTLRMGNKAYPRYDKDNDINGYLTANANLDGGLRISHGGTNALISVPGSGHLRFLHGGNETFVIEANADLTLQGNTLKFMKNAPLTLSQDSANDILLDFNGSSIYAFDAAGGMPAGNSVARRASGDSRWLQLSAVWNQIGSTVLAEFNSGSERVPGVHTSGNNLKPCDTSYAAAHAVTLPGTWVTCGYLPSGATSVRTIYRRIS